MISMWKRFIKWQYNYNFPVIKDPIVETKEKYYNNKYPKKNIAYKRTDRNGTIRIDVRQFLNHHNYKLMEIVGADDDEIAYESLMYVMDNIKYTPDKSQYGMNEYWCFNYETLNSKKGDCEDGAILLYSLMRKNGIPAWKIRLNAGNVKGGGGHAYLVYYVESKKKWVVLDWCYWPNTFAVDKRKEYKKETNYHDVWFSWNEDYAWSEGLNKKAEELLNS